MYILQVGSHICESRWGRALCGHLVLANERLFGEDLGPFEIGTEILNKNLNLKTAIRVRTKFGCLKQKCQAFRADLEPVELLVCE